ASCATPTASTNLRQTFTHTGFTRRGSSTPSFPMTSLRFFRLKPILCLAIPRAKRRSFAAKTVRLWKRLRLRPATISVLFWTIYCEARSLLLDAMTFLVRTRPRHSGKVETQSVIPASRTTPRADSFTGVSRRNFNTDVLVRSAERQWQQLLPLLLWSGGAIVIASIICTPHLPGCSFVCEGPDIFKRCNSRRGQHTCRHSARRSHD